MFPKCEPEISHLVLLGEAQRNSACLHHVVAK